MTIEEIKKLRESEDRVEFKQAENTFSFEGGSTTDYKKRRKCVLGYVVALANEGGGKLIFGVKENNPLHIITGSVFSDGQEGELEGKIYDRLKIRVKTEVLYEGDKRVLVLHIPSRPIGKVFTFEDTPLMRVGDKLLRMNDEQYLESISEQEPDFSATICHGLTMDDLSTTAISSMKRAYASKQNNQTFENLNDAQALSDLDLIRDGAFTYAALILLGKSESIKKYMPNSAIRLEYRNSSGQITFDKREIFDAGYFDEIDKLWKSINDRNGSIPVQLGAFIFDIPFFNQEVIREAINNAVAHRNYRFNSEVVIKVHHAEFIIVSPGGFPKGVTIENLIKVNSTPRNRLLADVLSKTGVVERSGQGVDKIYYQSLSEAKGIPDYSKSDDYQVELQLSGIVKDKAFALFIKEIQNDKAPSERLSVDEIIALDKIRRGANKNSLDNDIVTKLLGLGHIEKIGKTNSQSLRLSVKYYAFTDTKGKYTAENPLDPTEAGMLVQRHLAKFKEAKMSDFKQLLGKYYTENQIKYAIYGLADMGLLERKGKGSGTYYIEGAKSKNSQKLLSRALELGFAEMRKTGELTMPKSNSSIEEE